MAVAVAEVAKGAIEGSAPPAVPVAITRADTPEALFHAMRAADSARPVVTFYDRLSGERAELSAASLGNWVAKTHFLLTDELGLGRDDAAYVELPVHWMALALWFGVFSAGLSVTEDAAAADVAFADVESLANAAPAAEVYAVALLPWGRGFDEPPGGTTDYVSAVRVQPDAWASVLRPGTATDVALVGMSRAELMHAARERALELGLGASARVLVTDRHEASLSLLDVVAVFSVNGSLVLVRHAGSQVDDELIAQEQITATP